MLSGSKFRFCLQWGSDTSEKILAGELLNRLGNKKSEFVVNAVAEFVKNHPESVSPDSRLHISVHPVQSEEQLQSMVKQLAKAAVEELMDGMAIVPAADAGPTGPSQKDLNEMLENLTLFK